MVSVIIPAFDEADTIAAVVASVLPHPWVEEVIVVDDGSGDATAAVATQAGARVIRLDRNSGKTAAMAAGVHAAKSDILLFLDADVTGHSEQALSRIMQPVIDGRYEMHVGLRARSTLILNRLLRYFPIIGGERALTRRLWEALPADHVNGFEVEIALNYTAKQFDKGMGFELIYGTTHRTKEHKYGLLVGLARRLRMIGHVVSISFRLYVLGAIQRVYGRIKGRCRALVRARANG